MSTAIAPVPAQEAHANVHAITGHTEVYFILGDPIEQVLAPTSFNRIFAQMGINAVLVPMQVPPAKLADFVTSAFNAPNVKGLWVTIPHKSAVMPLLGSYSALAGAAGAVNAVRRKADGSLDGGLFDGEGFVAGLDFAGIAYAGQKVLVLGAGGAASAIGASLVLAGPRAAAQVSFFDPLLSRATALATRLNRTAATVVDAVNHNDPAGFDLVINASPLGLKASDPLPCDVTRLASHAALVDILMKNQPTPVVRAALARGLQAQAGFEMMIQQTHLYLDFFGFADAAKALRTDATFVRELIYPVELAHLIHP
jgi:shikimate dehydrogenase